MSYLDGYVQLQRAIKIDPDFGGLSPAGQWLYFQLLTDVNHIGVADWNPKRMALRASTIDVHYVETAALELVESCFAVLDQTSDEILIRTYMKYDGAHKQPNTCTSMVNAFGSVASKRIRSVVSHELQRVQDSVDRKLKVGGFDAKQQGRIASCWNILERITEYPGASAEDVLEPMMMSD